MFMYLVYIDAFQLESYLKGFTIQFDCVIISYDNPIAMGIMTYIHVYFSAVFRVDYLNYRDLCLN